MKHLLPFTLLFFILGCTKFEAEYTINCQFAPSFSANRNLVVTDYNGQVIGSFEVPFGVSNFSQRLKTSDENAQESYGLHLIEANECSAFIASHFDVPNGASVYLNAEPPDTGTYDYTFVRIHGIEFFDSLTVIGPFPPQLASYNAVHRYIDALFYARAGQGMVLRLRANGESEFKYLYLPDSVRVDTTLQWQDFKTENNPHIVELPGDGLARYSVVNTVSADFKHYLTLQNLYYWQNDNTQFVPGFNHPDGWATPAAYHVKVEQDNTMFEKIFQPGEALRFELPDIAIEDIAIGRDVSVRVKGDIDLIRARLFITPSNSACNLQWVIDGSVETFKYIKIPDLEKYVPEWINHQSFQNASVYAYQFGKHDYEQAREGFPFKSTEPFAVARSGFVAVNKFK
jgi:hypothetical protein